MPSAMSSHTGYSSVPQSPDTATDEKWSSEETLLSPQLKPSKFLAEKDDTRLGGIVALLLCCTYITCLGSALVAIIMMLTQPPATPAPNMEVDISTLERPSVYIDFQNPMWNKSLLVHNKPLPNLPFFFGQVSYTHADKVFPIDVDRWLTPWGMVSPDEDKIELNPDISTIMQTRVMDYGMERCKVVVEIPDEEALIRRPRNNHIDLRGDTTKVEVWRLDAKAEFDQRFLSRRSLPPRKELVGTLNVAKGMRSATAEFPCAERSLQTFELASPAYASTIKFTQTKEQPLFGFYIEQSCSL